MHLISHRRGVGRGGMPFIGFSFFLVDVQGQTILSTVHVVMYLIGVLPN